MTRKTPPWGAVRTTPEAIAALQRTIAGMVIGPMARSEWEWIVGELAAVRNFAISMRDEAQAQKPPMDPNRRLTYLFLSLPFHLRLEVAQKLGLFLPEDRDLSDSDLFARIFRRAAEKTRLGELWLEVEKRSGTPMQPTNPFAGR